MCTTCERANRKARLPRQTGPGSCCRRELAVYGLAPALLLCSTLTPALAGSKTWVPTTGNNWATAGNWSPAGPPSSSTFDTVTINNAIQAVVSTGGATASTVTIGTTAAGGTLLIQGGALGDTNAIVGANAGSIGTVSVDGSSSKWTNSGTLFLGSSGTGYLTLSNGGTVSATTTNVGAYGGSNGTLLIQSGGALNGTSAVVATNVGSTGVATITGAGSQWTNSGNVTVGSLGSGGLSVLDGGLISGNNGSIGANAGSIGTVTVKNAGSQWTSSGTLTIGSVGSGTLSVLNGGMVSSANGYVGANTGGNGTVTVDGSGSTWTSSGTIYLGNVGAGSMTLSNSGTASATTTYIGTNSGSSGTLLIQSGGGLNDTSAIIGANAGSTGMVTVDGPNSGWTNGGTLFLGTGGSGTLTLSNGGTAGAATTYVGVNSGSYGTLLVQSGGQFSGTSAAVGANAGSSGEVTVDGAGSAWVNSGTLYLGRSGTGSLNLSDGGAASAAATYVGTYAGSSGALLIQRGGLLSDISAIIGANAGSTGVAVVTDVGSQWINSGDITVGSLSSGTLSILDGGLVHSANGYVGANAGGNGTATVTGTGSVWTNSGALYLGGSSTGSLTLSSGGAASATAAYVGAYDGSNGTLLIDSGGTLHDTNGMLGVSAGSTGAATIDGPGSAWINSGSLLLGVGGIGSLTLTNGGAASADAAHIGVSEGATGTLLIESGGSVSSATGAIGKESGASGVVAITGAGSLWSNTGDLSVGASGSGALTIADGGSVQALDIYIGSQTGSDGTITIGAGLDEIAAAPGTLEADHLVFGQGAGMLALNHNASGYVFAPAMSGFGVIEARAGTTILTGDSSGFSGTTNIAHAATLMIGQGGNLGGSIGADGTLTLANARGLTIADTISGTGTIAVRAGTAVLTGDASGFSGATAIDHDAGLTLSLGGVLGGSIATEGALTFANTNELTFANAISGSGTLNKTEAGVLKLTGNSSFFTGSTILAAGGLVVDGSLAGSSVTVLSGATLSGSGTVGGIVAQAGSVIAPGNSPGVLTVFGDYTALSDSLYAAELVPDTAASDLLAIIGAATIEDGAQLQAVPYGSGGFRPNSRYTVLTASGGVTGTYMLTGDTSVSAFYGLRDRYDDKHVYLDVAQTRAFTDAARTLNQHGAASGLQSLPIGNSLRGVIEAMPDDGAARIAFDRLSGELHPSVTGALIQTTALSRLAILDRTDGALDGTICLDGTSRIGCPAMWLEGRGGRGRNERDDNARRASYDADGILGGLDVPAFGDARFGLFAGYQNTAVDAAGGDTAAIESAIAGAYGGAEWGGLSLRGGASYGWNEIASRRIVVIPGYVGDLASQYDAGTGQVFAELAYRFDLSGSDDPARISLEPFMGLSGILVHADGFAEQGGAAALTGLPEDTALALATLGLRGQVDFELDLGSLSASGMIGWRHAMGDLTPKTVGGFEQSDYFAVYGAPIGADALIGGLALSVRLSSRATLSASYEGELGQDTYIQGLRGAFSVSF